MKVLKLLQDGVLTRTELLDLCLSRIEKIKCLNAFITTLSKESIITNKEAEKTRYKSVYRIYLLKDQKFISVCLFIDNSFFKTFSFLMHSINCLPL